MNQKRKYIIDNLLVDDFIESESKIIQLEETEDSGRSLLEMKKCNYRHQIPCQVEEDC